MLRLAPSRRRLPLALAGLVLAAPLAARTLRAQQPEHYALGGDSVAIYDLAGRVRLEAGAGSEVTVEVVRGGSDAARLEVRSGAVRGVPALRVIYPADAIVYPMAGRSSTELRVADDGTFGNGADRDGSHRVRIRGSGQGLEAHADLLVSVPRGQRLALHLAVGDITVANVDGTLLVDASSGDVTASGTRGTLRLDTGSGDVRVTDAEGSVDLDTGSGSVRVDGVHGSLLRLDTGSGDVTGRDVQVARLDADVGSGGLRIDGLRAPRVSVDAGSGPTELGFLDDVDSLAIDAGSGGVTLHFPSTLGAMVDIDTGSGGIDLDFPVSVTKWERTSLHGRIGDGRGRIVIDAGSGGVRLLRS